MIEKSLTLKAETENLDTANEFLEGIFENTDIPMGIQFKINMALEELFVNVCHYAYEETGDIEIKVKIDSEAVEITLIDQGLYFDPLEKDDPDTEASIDERPIGGLGIFMVKKSMDRFEYERKNDRNIVTIAKNFK